MRVLIAGVGNVLRSDDAFGVRVIERLEMVDLGDGVRLLDAGIGGIHLVQELMDPVDLLLVIDTTDQGRPSGTVMVIEPEVADVEDMPEMQRYDFLADMHYAKPESAFMLARALGVLPRTFLLIGCQPVDATTLEIGMSAPVTAAIEVAVDEIQRLLEEFRAPASA